LSTTFLDRLTPDQRNTIVSLPYRVGLWVSDSDSSGGDEASRHERQVLSNIIHGFTEEMFGSEVMQHIMSATLAHKDQWPAWAAKISSVPEDCGISIKVMRDYAEPKDITVFCNHLMEIGEAVAMAFREDMAFGALVRARLSYILSKFKKKPGRLHNRSFQDYVRISGSEHKALATLAKALGATY
jgi:hypothetical protein